MKLLNKEESLLLNHFSTPERTAWESFIRCWETVNNAKINTDNTQLLDLSTTHWNLSLILKNFNPEIWQTLPLSEYQFIVMNEQCIEQIKDAVYYLADTHAELIQNKAAFLKVIGFLELRENMEKTHHRITSVTIPSLPLCSFFSESAGLHIPPGTVIKNHSKVFLAENIYHEMVHNMVNVNLLEADLLHENYDAKTCNEKIMIPWRSDDPEMRNRYWEIDRALHALSVYDSLLFFRPNFHLSKMPKPRCYLA